MGYFVMWLKCTAIIFVACELGMYNDDYSGVVYGVGCVPLYLICFILLKIFTHILWGIQVGYQDIAEMLLRMGADLTAVDNAGNSALHYAARGGHIPTIKWLIEQVVHINIRCACVKC